jgi:hypothetical protein
MGSISIYVSLYLPDYFTIQSNLVDGNVLKIFNNCFVSCYSDVIEYDLPKVPLIKTVMLGLFIKSFAIVSLINSLQRIKAYLYFKLNECTSFSEAQVNDRHHSFSFLYLELILFFQLFFGSVLTVW